MKAALFAILTCVGIGLFFIQQYQQINSIMARSRKATPTPHPPPLDHPPIVLTSTDIVVGSAKGDIGALVGKTIQVEADVTQRSDATTLLMKTMSPVIVCKYDPKDAPEGDALKDGDRVTVTGRASGYLANQLWLKSCRFAPRTTPLNDGWEVIKVPR